MWSRLGAPIQGSVDEGDDCNKAYPVIIAGCDPAGDAKTLELNADGSINAVIIGGAASVVPSKVDDSPFSIGTDLVSPDGYLFDDTATDSVNEGDIGAPRMSADRVAYSRSPDLVTSGTFTAAGQTIELDLYGRGSVAIQTSGVFTGSVNFEVSTDGTNWLGAQGINPLLSTRNSAVTSPTIMMIGTSGYSKFRARCATLTAGTIGVAIRATSGTYPVANVAEQALSGLSGSAFDARTNAPISLVTAASQSIIGINYNNLFNGTTWDRERGSEGRTILASAARTVTTNSADQLAYNLKGVILHLNITANPGGAETLTLAVQVKDPVSAVYRTITAFAAVVAAVNDNYVYILDTAAIETAAVANVEVQGLPLSVTWRVQVVPSGAGSWTYSVGGSLIQ